jgi:hypothetical protein
VLPLDAASVWVKGLPSDVAIQSYQDAHDAPAHATAPRQQRMLAPVWRGLAADASRVGDSSKPAPGPTTPGTIQWPPPRSKLVQMVDHDEDYDHVTPRVSPAGLTLIPGCHGGVMGRGERDPAVVASWCMADGLGGLQGRGVEYLDEHHFHEGPDASVSPHHEDYQEARTLDYKKVRPTE